MGVAIGLTHFVAMACLMTFWRPFEPFVSHGVTKYPV